jgi:hypothetical protein
MREEVTRRDVMRVGSAVFMSGTMGAASDGIFNSESPAPMVGLSGSASAGYAGAVSIGIATGTISIAWEPIYGSVGSLIGEDCHATDRNSDCFLSTSWTLLGRYLGWCAGARGADDADYGAASCGEHGRGDSFSGKDSLCAGCAAEEGPDRILETK